MRTSGVKRDRLSVRFRRRAAVAGATALLAGAAGCSVGAGAPDGWRYVRAGAVAVALPKTWHVTAGATGLLAELPGARGRTDAALALTAADPDHAPDPGPDSAPTARTAARAPARTAALHAASGAPARAAALVPAGPVPADARQETLTIDGSRARAFYYARPVRDGRPAGHVELRLRDPAGRAVTVRAWAVDGAAHDPALLREIVNGIEFPTR